MQLLSNTSEVRCLLAVTRPDPQLDPVEIQRCPRADHGDGDHAADTCRGRALAFMNMLGAVLHFTKAVNNFNKVHRDTHVHADNIDIVTVYRVWPILACLAQASSVSVPAPVSCRYYSYCDSPLIVADVCLPGPRVQRLRAGPRFMQITFML